MSTYIQHDAHNVVVFADHGVVVLADFALGGRKRGVYGDGLKNGGWNVGGSPHSLTTL
jgi:hypothetical protein